MAMNRRAVSLILAAIAISASVILLPTSCVQNENDTLFQELWNSGWWFITSASIATCTMKDIASRNPLNSKDASIFCPLTDQSLRFFSSDFISVSVSILWAMTHLLGNRDA